MSRYEIKTKDNGVLAYGFDHALGYFVDKAKTGKFDIKDMIFEKSSMFDGLTGVELAQILKEEDAPPEHITKAMLDLPV